MNILLKLFNHIRLAMRLIRDPRVPTILKVLPFAALAYVVMPIDIIPDMIPGLGQLDDLGVILLGLETFIRMTPQAVVEEHQQALKDGNTYSASSQNKKDASGNVVDGEWREVNRN